MPRCALVIPYFGKFPSYFQLFLNSCKKNIHFTWLIFTDDKTPFDFPENVIVKYVTFEETQRLFKQKLGKHIILKRPYKLCDYRPTYGVVYGKFLENYEYWGHCDIDLLFGDLEMSVRPLMEKGYDKIFAAGHLTLYKNNEENNNRFKLPLHGDAIFEQYSLSEKNHGFDEDGGNKKNVHNIFREYGYNVFESDLSFNCSDKYYLFHRSRYNSENGEWIIERKQKAFYYWKDGKIIETVIKNREMRQKEYIYMHFQGRKSMKVQHRGNVNSVWIRPDGFEIGEKFPDNYRDAKKHIVYFGGKNDIKMAIFRLKLFLGKLKIAYLRKRKEK